MSSKKKQTKPESEYSQRTEDWTFNDFLVFLSDAIIYDIEANKTPEYGPGFTARFARTSFINAALAVEAAANACLARLPYPPEVIEQLDRPQPLEKYVLLYQLKAGEKLITGHRLIQSVDEILRLRNTYVHAKLRREKVMVRQTGPMKHTFERTTPHLRPTPLLKLPRNPLDWTGQHSRTVVKTVLQFLNHFFMDLCHLTTQDANALFCSVVVEGQNTGFLGNYEGEACRQTKEIYGVEIKFLVFLPQPTDDKAA